MTSNRTILITGVTGNQGGAVARALLGAGFHLRGLTRTPDSQRAAALARYGIEVVKGDFDDEATLRRALAGAWGVFGVQNAGEAGVEREEAQGKRLAKLAREAGVEHYVYTSVGSAHKRTGIPHFDNKWRIEETVRGSPTSDIPPGVRLLRIANQPKVLRFSSQPGRPWSRRYRTTATAADATQRH